MFKCYICGKEYSSAVDAAQCTMKCDEAEAKRQAEIRAKEEAERVAKEAAELQQKKETLTKEIHELMELVQTKCDELHELDPAVKYSPTLYKFVNNYPEGLDPMDFFLSRILR